MRRKALGLCALIVVAGAVVGCLNATEEGATEKAATTGATDDDAEAASAEPVRITADQLAEVFAGSDVFLLDVRRPDEIERLGTVEGYTNIPIDELAGRLDELPRDRPILTA